MKLELVREQIEADVTIGTLWVNGVRECLVLEDPVREVEGQPVSSWKIKGETAIPFGTYDVQITRSARFGRDLPLLVAVPGFEGIRIHPGNVTADTEGCLLPGIEQRGKTVMRSRVAFDALFSKMRVASIRNEKITITIRRGDSHA